MGKWTKGPWAVSDSGCHVYTVAENLPRNRTDGYGCGNNFICDLHDGEYHEYANGEEMHANAALIAEAGTVAHETGLTPRELAEQRAELLEALKAAIACGMVPKASAADGGASKHSEVVRVADLIRAAIANAERKPSPIPLTL